MSDLLFVRKITLSEGNTVKTTFYTSIKTKLEDISKDATKNHPFELVEETHYGFKVQNDEYDLMVYYIVSTFDKPWRSFNLNRIFRHKYGENAIPYNGVI